VSCGDAGYPDEMTEREDQRINPEAPHAPGTPDLTDVNQHEPHIPEETPAEEQINEPDQLEQPD
jgi:hypothetical protein